MHYQYWCRGGSAAWITYLASTTLLDEVEVVLGCRSNDLQPTGYSELDRDSSDRGRATPDDESLADGRGLERRVRKTEEAFTCSVQPNRRRVEGKRKHRALIEGNRVRQTSRGASLSRRIQRKTSVLAVLRDEIERMPVCRQLASSLGGLGGVDSRSDTVSLLQMRDALSHLDDLAGEVLPQHHRPGPDEGAAVLHLPVHGVDGDGLVLNHDAAWSGRGHGCISYAEFGVDLIQPSCFVGRHCEWCE